MGCDIHIYSEHNPSGKQWVFHTADARWDEEIDEGVDYRYYPEFPADNRDYWFFGFLARVRRESAYSFDPKGVPDDASPEYDKLVEQYGDDGHSHSYLSLKDMKDKLLNIAPLRAELLLKNADVDISEEILNHNIARLQEVIDLLQEEAKDHGLLDDDLSRIVFFFDN